MHLLHGVVGGWVVGGVVVGSWVVGGLVVGVWVVGGLVVGCSVADKGGLQWFQLKPPLKKCARP